MMTANDPATILTCTHCQSAVTMTDDNGVTDPEYVRVEEYECAGCGRSGTLTLHPDGREHKTGCLA